MRKNCSFESRTVLLQLMLCYLSQTWNWLMCTLSHAKMDIRRALISENELWPVRRRHEEATKNVIEENVARRHISSSSSPSNSQSTCCSRRTKRSIDSKLSVVANATRTHTATHTHIRRMKTNSMKIMINVEGISIWRIIKTSQAMPMDEVLLWVEFSNCLDDVHVRTTLETWNFIEMDFGLRLTCPETECTTVNRRMSVKNINSRNLFEVVIVDENRSELKLLNVSSVALAEKIF